MLPFWVPFMTAAAGALLDFNDTERLRLRQSLIDEGLQL